MGLGEDELWELTLAQFDALTARYKDKQEWIDYRTGLIAAIIANVNRDPKRRSQAFTPQDFMPGRQPQPRQRTAADIEAEIILINTAMGGDVVKKDF